MNRGTRNGIEGRVRGVKGKVSAEDGRIVVPPAVEADGRDEQTVAVQQVIARLKTIPEK